MSNTAEKTSDLPVVLVLGLTGAGKTSFTNRITGSDFPVGSGMESCTTTSEEATSEIDGVKVGFVDTPGFDDPEKTDAGVLIDITKWIETKLGGKCKVTAALYLHSIATKRMHGSALRNLNMFAKLIGSQSMGNVGLVSTHWDVVESTIAETREEYLSANSWSLMIKRGARKYRLGNDYHSCHEMVIDLLRSQPTFVKIKEEMAFQRKPLSRTEVGEDVCRELRGNIKLEVETIKELEDELRKDEAAEDVEFLSALAKSYEKLEIFKSDLERVAKILSWWESAVHFGRQRWTGAAMFLASQATTLYFCNTNIQALEIERAELLDLVEN